MKRYKLAVSCFLISVCCLSSVFASENPPHQVIYPKPASNADVRDQYFYELLKLSLEKSRVKYGEFDLRHSEFVIPSSRIPKEVRKGRYLNILTSPVSHELESNMRSINIPLVKGIQGIRVLLLTKNNIEKVSQIENFEQLKDINYGHGAGWVDQLIFSDAKLPVTTVPDYNSLFKMLNQNRFDAFPRGINEIYREYDLWRLKYPDLAIDKNLVIYYDLPVFFFVEKSDKRLHDRVEFGLNVAIEDGSFDNLFEQYFGAAIRKANLAQRKVFQLVNQYMPEIDKKKNESYWLPFIVEKISSQSSPILQNDGK